LRVVEPEDLSDMADLISTNGVRIGAYLVAALAALWAGWRERGRTDTNRYLWPTFWFLTAGVLVVMGVGRAGNLPAVLTEFGRRRAIEGGWYADRRHWQALVIGLIAGVWFVVVSVALWRVPERRRRYLPMAIVTFTIICFAGIRAISLHQIDALLYRRHLHGVQIDVVVELVLLLLAAAATLPRPPSARVASQPVRTR
jgi:hypothetical protein